MPLFTKVTPYLRNHQFLSLAGNLTASGLTVVSVSLLFRALPVQDIGAWVFFLSLQGLGEAFRSGCLTTAFIRSYSGADRGRAAEVMGSTWALALLLTGALMGLVLAARLLPGAVGNVSLVLFIKWFPLTFGLTLPSFVAACALQAQLRFGQLLCLRLLTQLPFILGVGVLMAQHQLTLERVVYCNLGAAAVTSGAALLLGWSRLRDLRHQSAACRRELAHFGKYSVGSYIGSYLLRSSDTLLINFLLGPSALAVYNLAQRFMEIIEIPLRSFMATAIPSLARAFNRGDKAEMSRLIQRNAGLLTWGLAPVIAATVLLADIPVFLIGGSKYAHTEAANVLRLTITMAILFPIDRFTGVALDVLNRPHVNLLKVFLMLTVNIGGDLLGIWLCGNIYGVALASLPTIMAGFLFGYRHMKQSLPMTLADILRAGLLEAKRLAQPGKTPAVAA